MIIETNSEKETFELGKKIGENAKAGQIYTLTGDLGVGKTVFTKGLAKGLGITESVCSPTFTIVQIYEEGRLPLYHFDVYRIGDPEEMDEIGYEDCFYGEGVCLIEWAGSPQSVLPIRSGRHPHRKSNHRIRFLPFLLYHRSGKHRNDKMADVLPYIPE